MLSKCLQRIEDWIVARPAVLVVFVVLCAVWPEIAWAIVRLVQGGPV